MKTRSIALLFCLVSFGSSGQRMTQNQAWQIFNGTTRQLNTNDTAAFVNMWLYDDTPRPSQETPFTRQHARGYFEHIREWIDTALTRNLKIDHIDIETRASDQQQSPAYLIKAWYRYDKNYAKGYGFYVDFVNGAWRFRNNPETSAARRE